MRQRLGRGESGQSIVEFALIGVIFFTLLLGIFDAGRVFMAWVLVTNEAREGARFATVSHDVAYPGRPTVEAYVRDRTQRVLDQSALTVTYAVAGSPKLVQVQLTYRMSLITPLIGQFFPDPVLVSSQSWMQAE